MLGSHGWFLSRGVELTGPSNRRGAVGEGEGGTGAATTMGGCLGVWEVGWARRQDCKVRTKRWGWESGGMKLTQQVKAPPSS